MSARSSTALLVILVTLSLAITPRSAADIAVFQQGTGPEQVVEDTSLIFSAGMTPEGEEYTRQEENYGVNSSIHTGYHSGGSPETSTAAGLIRFDVSRLQGAVVQSAALFLYLEIPSGFIGYPGYVPWIAGVKQVPAVDGDWVAGTSNGTIEPGASCYTQKRQGMQNWATYLPYEWYDLPQGCIVGAATGTVRRFGTYGPEFRQVRFDLPADWVSAWADSPGCNPGLVIYGVDCFVLSGCVNLIASSDWPDLDLRPLLSVSYIPVPEPSSLLAMGMGAGGLACGVRFRRRRRR